MTDPKKATTFASWPRLRGRIIACALIAVGGIHAFKPQWLTLDWPSIVLIGLGVLLLIIPLDDLGGIVESLEVGKTKILFRKVHNLDESVRTAEAVEEVKPVPAQLPTIAPQAHVAEDEKQEVDLEKEIHTFLSASPRMTLIKIDLEIQRMISELTELVIGRPARLLTSLTWRKDLIELRRIEAISNETFIACINFHDLRDQIIHDSLVPDEAVISAVDSGIKLFRILSVTLRAYQTSPARPRPSVLVSD